MNSRANNKQAFGFNTRLKALSTVSIALSLAACGTLQGPGQVSPSAAGYFQPSVHASANKLAENIPQDKLTTASRQLVREGLVALDEKKYEKASSLFNMALQTDINNSYVHFLNGLAYHLRGVDGEGKLYALAQQGYQMAIQFDSSNTIARHFLGLLYMDRREYKQAKEALMEAVLYDPNDKELLFDLTTAAYYAKDPATSYAALQGILATKNKDTLDENSVELLRALAIVAAAAGDDQAAKAFVARLAKVSSNPRELGFVEGRVNTWQRAHAGGMLKTQFGGAPAAAPSPQPAAGGLGAPPAAAAGAPGAAAGRPGGGFFDKNMVMLDVSIIATQEDNTDTFGVNLLDGLRIQFGNSSGAAAVVRNSVSDLVNSANNTASITRIIQIPAITYTMNIANAQERRNEVLARPSLVATGGLASTFFSGTDVIGAAVSNGQGGSVQVQKEAGVKLTVTPEFLPDNVIKMQIIAERTFLATPNSNVQFDFRLDTSKTIVNANVAMKYGETLILSGLSERNTEVNSSGVPLLRDIPLVQYLFNRKSKRDFFNSVLILVTPRHPSYTNRAKEDIDAEREKMTEFEKVQNEFENKYKLWFNPVPTTAIVAETMEISPLFREFRAGDLKLESWMTRSTLGNRLKAALNFIYY